MRILLATDTFLPHINGVAISILRQAEALSHAGHTVKILGPHHLDVTTPVQSFSLFRTVDPTYRLEIPKRLSEIRLELRKADLVHIHTPFGFGQAVERQARSQGTKVLYTHHTNFFEHYLHYLGRLECSFVKRILMKAYRHFLKHCQRIIVPTETARLGLQGDFPTTKGKVSVLQSLGFVPGPYTGGKQQPSRDIDVAYIGRIAPEKNAALAIDVLERLCRNRAIGTAVVLGDGVQFVELQGLTKHISSTQLRYMGAVSTDEVKSVLLRSKVLLFTSKSDTQGLVIDEAHSCGVPVVCVDSPLARERIRPGTNGWIAPEESRAICRVVTTALAQMRSGPETIQASCAESSQYSTSLAWTDELLQISKEL